MHEIRLHDQKRVIGGMIQWRSRTRWDTPARYAAIQYPRQEQLKPRSTQQTYHRPNQPHNAFNSWLVSYYSFPIP